MKALQILIMAGQDGFLVHCHADAMPGTAESFAAVHDAYAYAEELLDTWCRGFDTDLVALDDGLAAALAGLANPAHRVKVSAAEVAALNELTSQELAALDNSALVLTVTPAETPPSPADGTATA